MFQEFPDLAKEKSEMERVVEMGTGESDRTLANQIARSDITKLYLMSELLFIVVVVVVVVLIVVFLLLLLCHRMLVVFVVVVI